MFAQKLIGWVLVIVAIFAICWGVYDSYKIFIGQKLAPQIFAEQKQTISNVPANSIDAVLQQIIRNQVANTLPSNSVSNLFNLIAWSMFMGILFWASGQIAGIGIKLLSLERKTENN